MCFGFVEVLALIWVSALLVFSATRQMILANFEMCYFETS